MILWFACQLVVLGLVTYAAICKEVEWDKENIMFVCLMVLFGPLSLFAIFCTCAYENRQSVRREQCARAVSAWERTARSKSTTNRWDWYMDKKVQEERFNLLRESIRSVPDDDLRLLSTTSKNTYEIDKALREAIVDELIERRILST